MADIKTSDKVEDETPNQRQARLRREKRQKKMAEQGEDRLAKIKALNGGVGPPAEILGGPKGPKGTDSNQTIVHDDPDEVDIETVSGTHTPSVDVRNRAGNKDTLMAGMIQQQEASRGQQQGGDDDPMVKMMQQFSNIIGGSGNAEDPNSQSQTQQDLPPLLKAMLKGQAQTEKESAQAPTKGSAYVWRIVHAVFAFSLAIYIASTSSFNGTKLARSQTEYGTSSDAELGHRLFIIFTSVELVLQSSRYFIERGQLQGSGIVATIANSGILPDPYAGYVRTLGRYMTIAQTIVSDAMVVVFVFGALAWWRSTSSGLVIS
ncbi:hypothetical protein M433DRAFT_5517 [Acidomyces richmondensis BFW]|nr:MAG: hypothetical protein FE78DRAFT_457426 [Acidomyces sp. 'richmondensis']KYG44360.1 hypothetical protein M433DRAFT_5517 [Acidomyces richmondensis BFW]